MKAIVIFLRTHDVKVSAGQPLAVPISRNSHEVAVSDADKTNRVDKSAIRNEPMPPLWTWFIENPRPHSVRSFRGIVELTFSA